MFVTERTLVRPDKAATRCCLCFFRVYSKCILQRFIVFTIMALNLFCTIYLPSLSVSLLRKHMQCFSLHCLSFLFTLFASFCGLQFSISLPVYLVQGIYFVMGEMCQTVSYCTLIDILAWPIVAGFVIQTRINVKIQSRTCLRQAKMRKNLSWNYSFLQYLFYCFDSYIM